MGSHWDAHARVYERVWERSTLLWGRDALVLGRLAPGSRLLDVACGSGALAVHAAQLGLDVTAVDASSAMIERLHAKLASTGDASRLQVSARVVDGHTLDGLADASFDAVCSNFGIFLFPDRGAAWKSVWRVLAPGGKVLATSWDEDNFNVRLIRFLLENAEDKPLDTTESNAVTVTPVINRMMAAASFREELAECGFEKIRIHTLTHAMCFDSGEEFVSGVLDNKSFLSMVGHKQEASLAWCTLEFARRELAGGSTEDFQGVDNGNPETHPLWCEAFALQAVAHVAVASKPES